MSMVTVSYSLVLRDKDSDKRNTRQRRHYLVTDTRRVLSLNFIILSESSDSFLLVIGVKIVMQFTAKKHFLVSPATKY